MTNENPADRIQQEAAALFVMQGWPDEFEGYTLADLRLAWGGNTSTVLVDLIDGGRWVYSFVVELTDDADHAGRVQRVGMRARRVAVA